MIKLLAAEVVTAKDAVRSDRLAERRHNGISSDPAVSIISTSRPLRSLSAPLNI